MIVTLGQITDAEPALKTLSGLRLPIKSSYRIAKLLRTAQAELEIFRERRNDIIKELGEDRPTTGAERAQTGLDTITSVKAEKLAEFFQRETELRDIKVPLDWEPLEASILDGQSLTPGEVLALEPFLKAEA